MDNRLRGTITLFIIAALSGLSIFLVNNLTKDRIAANLIAKSEVLYEELFPSYDHYETVEIEGTNMKQITMYDSSNAVEGYIYENSGVNSYGDITVLVGIDTSDNIIGVKFLTINQSPGFKETVIEDTEENYTGITPGDVDDIDTSTGATYGSTLVNDLVKEVVDYHVTNF